MATFLVYHNGASHTVLLDDCDLVWVSRYEWKISAQGYCYRQDPERGYVRLHREVMGEKDRRVYIDHKNNNRLDNRRENLRKATPQQNAANNSPKSCYGGSVRASSFKGVSFRRGRWRMNIKLPDGTKVDRLFDDEKEAARAYDGLALFFYGAFARKNFQESIADQAAGVALAEQIQERRDRRRVARDEPADDGEQVGPGSDLAGDATGDQPHLVEPGPLVD